MKNILVAVDFSESSRKAMDYAAALAKSFNANIVLLHAFYIPVPVGDVPGYIPLSFAEVQEENEALLQREIEYMAGKYEVRTDGYVRNGFATAVINDVAAEVNPSLVVMGMKGAGKSSGIFGSTVISAIRKVKLPLLVIPADAEFSFIKHISFAADFKENLGVERLGILEEIAGHFNADVQVLHVQKNEAFMAAGEAAGKVGADVAFSRMKHSFHTMVDEDVERGITDFISTNATDLLVMVAHHHNLFERLFGKEHTRLIAYTTRVPLLVLHDA
ncbi:MAG: universal stress protein [Chitinophagaceae bacterium]|nr:universal stress protein [Chitinophagaceae bacterium]